MMTIIFADGIVIHETRKRRRKFSKSRENRLILFGLTENDQKIGSELQLRGKMRVDGDIHSVDTPL